MAARLGERLIAAGLTTPQGVERALEQQKLSGNRIGDCLVELGLIDESALLRVLAKDFGTRFVTAEKLAHAKIPHEVMDRVPVRVAEAQGVLPIAYHPEDRLLSIVAAEPQNKHALEELALVAGVEEVVAFVGLKRSISAGIRKHYYSDPHAFDPPLPPREPPREDSKRTQRSETGSSIAPGPSTGVDRRTTSATRPGNRFNQARESTGGIDPLHYMQTVGALIGLIERASPRAGHTARVARVCDLAGQLLGLPPQERVFAQLVAHLHDLGQRHLTLFQLEADPARQVEARKLARLPLSLLGEKGLPSQAAAALAAQFDRFDGAGVTGMKGGELPMIARLLHPVDAAVSALEAGEPQAEVLRKLDAGSGTLFDPEIASVVGSLVRGEPTRRMLLQRGRVVRVVDPRRDRLGASTAALVEAGLHATPIVLIDDLAELIPRRGFDVLVMSTDAGAADCASAIQLARMQPESAGLPIVVYGVTDRADHERLDSAGANVLLQGDTPADIVSAVNAQLASLIATGGAGHPVDASTELLPLFEVTSVLTRAAASGRLTVRAGRIEGALHFERGAIVAASAGAHSGEAALEALLQTPRADWTYDPEALLLELPAAPLHFQKRLAARS